MCFIFQVELNPKYIVVTNGYAELKKAEEQENFVEKGSEEWETLKRKVRVGLHENVQVVWGRRKGKI